VFVEIFANAEKFVAKAITDSDYEETAVVALLMLAVYFYKELFGDDWQEQVPEEVLALYNEYMENTNQSNGNGGGDNLFWIDALSQKHLKQMNLERICKMD